MDEQAKVQVWDLDDVYRSLEKCYEDLLHLKPNDRSKKDRAVAVVMTDLEKMLAYYNTYILKE